jgi:hypothetical protein
MKFMSKINRLRKIKSRYSGFYLWKKKVVFWRSNPDILPDNEIKNHNKKMNYNDNYY